jgi:hypothetical protein
MCHDRVRHEAIPGFAGTHVKQSLTIDVSGAALDAGYCNSQGQARPTAIRHQQIASTSKNKESKVV